MVPRQGHNTSPARSDWNSSLQETNTTHQLPPPNSKTHQSTSQRNNPRRCSKHPRCGCSTCESLRCMFPSSTCHPHCRRSQRQFLSNSSRGARRETKASCRCSGPRSNSGPRRIARLRVALRAARSSCRQTGTARRYSSPPRRLLRTDHPEIPSCNWDHRRERVG